MTRLETEVVQMDGEDIILVRGLRDLRRVCMDWAHFSNDVLGRIQIPAEDQTRDFRQYPIEFDPPAHGNWRALVDSMFARPRTPEFEARISDLVSWMVADLRARGGGEIVRDFALPLQSRALAVLLDMPLSEGDLWASWGFHVFRSEGENDLDRAGALVRYLERTLDAATGDDSFFGRLQRMTIDGRPLTRHEQLGFAHLVFAGGRDTVINLISGGIGYLARNPAIFARPKKPNPRLRFPQLKNWCASSRRCRCWGGSARVAGRSKTRRFNQASGSDCALRRPTVIRQYSMTPTRSESTEIPTRMSPSAAVRTPVWVTRMPVCCRGRS